MLADPTPQEQEILPPSIRAEQGVTLYTDEQFMPKTRRCWAQELPHRPRFAWPTCSEHALLDEQPPGRSDKKNFVLHQRPGHTSMSPC